MLRAGMVVRTIDGRVVMLKGRNACNLAYWWGWLVKDGRPDTNTMPVLLAGDVVGVKMKSGAFQMILPGIFR